MFRKLLNFLSDSFIYGLSGIFAQLVNFFLLPIYTRYLTLEDYGTLALLAILNAIFIPVACMGLSPAIFRFYREEGIDRKVLLSTGVFSVVLSSVVLLSGTSYFAENIGNILLAPDTERSKALIFITLCTAAAMSVSTMFLTSLRANRRPIATVVVTSISLIIQISLSIAFVVVWEMGVMGVTLGILCGAIISLLLLFVISLNAINFKIELSMLVKMLSYGIFHVPTQIISLLNVHSGQYILKNLVSVKGLGLYSIASRFMMPVTLVGSSIQYAHTAVFFQVLNEDDNPEDTLCSIATYFVVGISLLWVIAAIWGPEILRLMTTPSFHEAYVYIGPLGLIPVLLLLYTFLASGIDSGKNLRPYMLVNVIGLIVLIGASYILIKHIGVYGAILGAVSSRLVMIFVAIKFSQDRLPVKYNYTLITFIIVLASSFAVAPHAIYEFGLVNRILISLTLMFLFPLLCIMVMSMFRLERSQIKNGIYKLKENLSKKFNGSN